MTTPYTSLKGFNSFNDVDISSESLQSVIMFFDWGFINKGAFSNVLLGHTDINSNNHATLRMVSDPNYSDGQVWETFRHNLVWESGLATNTQPISISGVYVNGSFKTPTTSSYQHYVDYNKGRVIFDSAIPTTSNVKMEYSYKTVTFDKLSMFPEPPELQTNPYTFQPGYDSAQSGEWSTLLRRQTPLVQIELSENTKYKPVSLGTGASYVYTDMLFHIFDYDDSTVSKLLSLISLQKEKTIYRIDMDLMVASGAFPLDYRGAKSSNPKTYADLINGNYRHAQLRFDDVVVIGAKNITRELYHGVVKFTTETIAVV